MGKVARAGYKQTELGVIPLEWDLADLSEVSFKITDGEHVTPIRTKLGYFLLSARNVLNGRIDVSDVDYVGVDEYARIKQRCNPEPGDILISCSGTIGRVSVVPEDFKCVLVRSAALAKLDRSKVDSNFIQFWLQAENAQGQIFRSVNQGAQPNLFLNHIERLRCPKPPLPEQRAIATALSDVDALLTKLDALIVKKRDLKVATMQQLLTGQTRLPGFSGEWKVKRLDALADIRSGGTPSTTEPKFWHGDVLWCTPTDITALAGSKYLSQTSRTITSAGLLASSAELVPVGSVVMTSRATIGECAINSVPMTTNQGFKNFIPFPSIDSEFLYYLLQTKKQDFIGLCSGSTFLEIGKTQLVRFEVKVPVKAEQTAIATVLADMDTELAVLKARLDKTRALKQGMMQELLTGRIRLIDARVTTAKQSEQKSAEAEQPHSWAFNEAVVIAVLADQFGKPEFPLGRMRYTKLAYLMHRKAENDAQGYLKKRAGPYNPQTRYAGPEKIAQQNGYVRAHSNGKFKGWVGADKIEQAKNYFDRWYGPELQGWLEQFRYTSNDGLERLATVDMAMKELAQQGKPVDLNAVRTLIESEPEWAPKLTREVFSDDGIAAAMAECRKLFSG